MVSAVNYLFIAKFLMQAKLLSLITMQYDIFKQCHIFLNTTIRKFADYEVIRLSSSATYETKQMPPLCIVVLVHELFLWP